MKITKLAVALMFASVAGSALADDSLLDALAAGKVSLDLRARAEYADDSVKKEANAETLRTVLGYRTAPYAVANDYLTGYVEFENVTDFGREHYNSGAAGAGNKRTEYTMIPDPDITQVNQAYIEAFGFKAGRQKVVLDNARFVGDVGWRQNDQTFDAISYQNKMIPDTTINLAYLTKVHTILGVHKPIDAPLVNVKYSGIQGLNLTGFYYAFEEQKAEATSFQHAGVRLDGKLANFLYELSFAQQSDYADGTEVGTPEADYFDVQLGYKFGPVTVKVQHEVLEKGFKTPYATLHAFNGWADMFLATPAAGLKDTNIKVSAQQWGLNFALALHDFQAEDVSQKFGQEVDFSVGKKFENGVMTLLKAAAYTADDEAPAAGMLNKDRTKVWLQFSYSI